MENAKREWVTKDKHAVKKQKLITLEVKFKWNVNRIIEEITTSENEIWLQLMH